MPQTRRSPEAQVCQFSGAKIIGTIPVLTALVGDAIIQACLDPDVTVIEHLASTTFRSVRVDVDAVIITRDGRRLALDVADARHVRNIDDDGMILLALHERGIDVCQLTEADLRKEPRYSNARIVWSHRSHRIAIGLRMQILQTLADAGALRIGDLLKSVTSDHDPVPAVMALACADQIELELDEQPLGPETVVRARRGRT
jgi:hypothetical protein